MLADAAFIVLMVKCDANYHSHYPGYDAIYHRLRDCSLSTNQ
jgi:hypothetical protein